MMLMTICDQIERDKSGKCHGPKNMSLRSQSSMKRVTMLTEILLNVKSILSSTRTSSLSSQIKG